MFFFVVFRHSSTIQVFLFLFLFCLACGQQLPPRCFLSIPGNCSALESALLDLLPTLCDRDEDQCRINLQRMWDQLVPVDSESVYSGLVSPTALFSSATELDAFYLSNASSGVALQDYDRVVAAVRLAQIRDDASRIIGREDALLANTSDAGNAAKNGPTLCIGQDWVPAILPYSSYQRQCNNSALFNASRTFDMLQTRRWQNLRLSIRFVVVLFFLFSDSTNADSLFLVKARARCNAGADECR